MVAGTIEMLFPATIPTNRGLQSKDETRIYHRASQISPRDKQFACKEIENIIDAGITTPASSAWYFPIVIVAKKDDRSRIYIYELPYFETKNEGGPLTIAQDRGHIR